MRLSQITNQEERTGCLWTSYLGIAIIGIAVFRSWQVATALGLILPVIAIERMRLIWLRTLAVQFRPIVQRYIAESSVLVDIIELYPQKELAAEQIENGILEAFKPQNSRNWQVRMISDYCQNWYQKIVSSQDSDLLGCIEFHVRYLRKIIAFMLLTGLMLISALPVFGLPWKMDTAIVLLIAVFLAWMMTTEYRSASNDLNNLFEAEVIDYLLRELDFGRES